MKYFKIENPRYTHKPEIENFVRPEDPEKPIILLKFESKYSYFEARFALELAGVIRNENYQKNVGNSNEKDNIRKGKIYNSLLSVITSNQGIDFIYNSVKSEQKEIIFTFNIEGISRGKTSEEATSSAYTLWQDLNVILGLIDNDYCFATIKGTEKFQKVDISDGWLGTIKPLGIAVNLSRDNPIGFKRNNPELSCSCVIVTPYNENNNWSPFDSVVIGSASCPSDIRVVVSIRPFMLSEDEIENIALALKWLRNGEKKQISYYPYTKEGIEDEKLMNSLKTALDKWLSNPSGFQIACKVISEKIIPTSFLYMLGNELFSNSPFSVKTMRIDKDSESVIFINESNSNKNGVLDLRGCINSADLLPNFLPHTETLIRYGIRRIYKHPGVKMSNDGILLGIINTGKDFREVRFTRDDRSKHCYILGATGTGKSTLLFNMIRQDIVNKEGVCVIDPHGDLYQQVLESIPRERTDDVVIINPCDFENAVGINFLECSGRFKSFQMNYIVNEMITIFDRLYDLKQTGGPIFEQYMRHAILLCMDNDIGATLMDVILVFEDEEYREFLMRRCKNPIVVSFWKALAEKANGDLSLNNLAPYITSKLNQFTTNGILRPIIGQRKSTIDFRKVIDERKILLVNLPKGFLGEFDTKLLGMLLIGKIFSSAMGRINTRPVNRYPFFLYIDEFQNFITDTIAHLLSEARKFGIYITLANQNLSQLSSGTCKQNIQDAVLGNVGTVLMFRIGPVDAEKMQGYTKPYICEHDLQELPDYHVAGRLLSKNSLSRPIIFETLPPQTIEGYKKIDEIIKASQKKYTTPVSKVEKEILAWRENYKYLISTKQEIESVLDI
uniref:DUF87 domain-containing protein n=1 Tax=Dictyoglomus turgidum TaxID=513050 RepID=A0A7C3WWS5_9BACT